MMLFLPATACREEAKEVTLDSSRSSPGSKRLGTTDLSNVADLLRLGGVLSQQLPGYRERPAQIEMVKLVAEALTKKKHAIVEASTGTGKSLSYLIPIVRSGRTAIISTANKALQEQLFFKDIPFVQRHIQWFEAALVKGFGNYLCLDRLEEARTAPLPPIQRQLVEQVLALSNDPTCSFNGDLETLDVSLPDDLRARINGDRDQCAWSKCPHFSRCFLRRMREQAQRAQVIVVNHTLLLLDAMTDGAILPDREVVVVDEAHHLEEEATRTATVMVKASQITAMLALKAVLAHAPGPLRNEIAACLAHIWRQLEQDLSKAQSDKAVLREPVQEGLRLSVLLRQLAAALQQQPALVQTEKEAILAQKRIQRIQTLADHVQHVCAVSQPNEYVYYLERVAAAGQQPATVALVAAPLDVASWLKERLFDARPVICASATLATVSATARGTGNQQPTFAYFKQRVGLAPGDTLERILPLTFDYPHQALLYVPRDLPTAAYDNTPEAQQYIQAIATRMEYLVKLSQGRAFLLFSSRRMLDLVYESIAPHLSYPVLRQGELPRAALVQRFREKGGAVLFGLKTFWEGVDIAGEALSLVVIDKVPFDPPDDPVHAARIARLKARGKDWFGAYVLPQAVLQLKQGLGRLLRTDDDRGVMAILDTRLHTKGYGNSILRALPPAPLVTRIEEVQRFFARMDTLQP